MFITIELPDAKDVKLTLQPDGHFYFSAKSGADNIPYELDLELFDSVNVDVSNSSLNASFYHGLFRTFESVSINISRV